MSVTLRHTHGPWRRDNGRSGHHQGDHTEQNHTTNTEHGPHENPQSQDREPKFMRYYADAEWTVNVSASEDVR